MAEQLSDTYASLDDEVRRVRTEIADLANRKSALTASILTPGPLLDILHKVASSHERARLEALSRANSKAADTRAYQLLSGATMFNPADPALESLPFAFDRFRAQTNVLGIRFDRFDQVQRKFLQPATIVLEAQGIQGPLLNANSSIEGLVGDEIQWKVEAHNLPSWLMVEAIAYRYLDAGKAKIGINEASRSAWTDLQSFVREVQGELIAGLRRHEAITRLQNALPRGWKSVQAMSSDAREAKAEWEDGRLGRVLLDKTGAIEKAVVTSGTGSRDKITESELMQAGHILRLRSPGTDAM